MITTLTDFTAALVTALQYEDAAKWATGDTVCVAISAGLAAQIGGVRKLEQHAAQVAGRGLRTIHRRRVVSETFAPDQRNERVAWETHCRIAELARTSAIDPHAWLQIAADDEMTADQVEAAIKAVDGDAERGQRVYVCKAVEARMVWAESDGVGLAFDRDMEWPAPDTKLIVTIAYE